MSAMFFRDLILTYTLPTRGGGGVCERGYGRISGGMRVLELAAGSREAALEQGACVIVYDDDAGRLQN
jgi:hypothetical protein